MGGMTSESSDLDEIAALGQKAPTDKFELHRESDRHDWDDFWDSPTFEKWRKGGKWTSA